MAVAINSFRPTQSPIEGIANALKAVETYYGIKGASQHADLMTAQVAKAKAEQAQADQMADPNSPVSKKTQQDQSNLYDMLSRDNLISPDKADAAKKLISGTPGEEGHALAAGLSGPEKPEVAATPGLSAFAIGKDPENGPLLKYAMGKQKADTTLTAKDMALQTMIGMMNTRNANTQEKTDLNANSKYQASMAPFEGTIQASNRALDIINKIKNADPNDPNAMKSTKLMRADLGNTLGSLFNQGKASTVHGAVGANQDTAFGKLGDAYTALSGTPTNTVPAGILNQMSVDIGSLRDSYADAHNTAFQSMQEGMPDRVKPALQARFDKFRSLSGLDSGSADTGKYSKGGGVPFMGSANASDSSGLPPMTDIQAEMAKRKANKK